MKRIDLPDPHLEGDIEELLYGRRSIRKFTDTPLELTDLSALLWASIGKSQFRRTVPSAGARYPLELFVLVGEVNGVETGFYSYEHIEHRLECINDDDLREELCDAALTQRFIEVAPLNLIIAADFERTTDRYGDRGARYVHMEVGHVGQNVYLACEALGLGTVAVGAFNDERVREVLDIVLDPLYIMSVGHKDLNMLTR